MSEGQGVRLKRMAACPRVRRGRVHERGDFRCQRRFIPAFLTLWRRSQCWDTRRNGLEEGRPE